MAAVIQASTIVQLHLHDRAELKTMIKILENNQKTLTARISSAEEEGVGAEAWRELEELEAWKLVCKIVLLEKMIALKEEKMEETEKYIEDLEEHGQDTSAACEEWDNIDAQICECTERLEALKEEADGIPGIDYVWS